MITTISFSTIGTRRVTVFESSVSAHWMVGRAIANRWNAWSTNA